MNTSRTLLAAAFAALTASVAAAATQQARSLEALVADSQAIVVGEAVSAHSEWEGGSLVTRYTFQVAETLKGVHEAKIVVSVPGGVDRNRKIPIAMMVPGAPTLLPNESVVLMLRQERAGYSILGLNQGFFRGQGPPVEGLRQRIRALLREERRP